MPLEPRPAHWRCLILLFPSLSDGDTMGSRLGRPVTNAHTMEMLRAAAGLTDHPFAQTPRWRRGRIFSAGPAIITRSVVAGQDGPRWDCARSGAASGAARSGADAVVSLMAPGHQQSTRSVGGTGTPRGTPPDTAPGLRHPATNDVTAHTLRSVKGSPMPRQGPV